MTVHHLTAAEEARLYELCRRLQHLQTQAAQLREIPVDDIHEETGFHVWPLLILLATEAERVHSQIWELMS